MITRKTDHVIGKKLVYRMLAPIKNKKKNDALEMTHEKNTKQKLIRLKNMNLYYNELVCFFNPDFLIWSVEVTMTLNYSF